MLFALTLLTKDFCSYSTQRTQKKKQKQKICVLNVLLEKIANSGHWKIEKFGVYGVAKMKLNFVERYLSPTMVRNVSVIVHLIVLIALPVLAN
jgi:hypothetical protein